MPSRPPGEVIVARLRAQGKLPRDVPAHLVRSGRSWEIADPVTGRALGFGSRFPAKAVAAARRWRLREETGVVLLEPGDGQPSDLPFMQAGMKLAVRVRASRPDGSLHRHGAVAWFYRPGKDPQRLAADRIPDRQVTLSFDAAARAYGAEVSTDGWEPGDWTMQGVVLGPDGAAEGWDWAGFPLDP